MFNLHPTQETAYSSKLADAYDDCAAHISFTDFREIYQALKRCKEIEALGLSGLSDRMYPVERWGYRKLQQFLHSRELAFGSEARQIFQSAMALC